jgi:hypothetical protein
MGTNDEVLQGRVAFIPLSIFQRRRGGIAFSA